MPAPVDVVPRHEPEVIAAGVRKRGSGEKVPTTGISELLVTGVRLRSRYGKAHELECMARMVMAVRPPCRHLIESIWCDSKAMVLYEVHFKEGVTPRTADAILDELEEASGGHNGIGVSGVYTCDREPNWPWFP